MLCTSRKPWLVNLLQIAGRASRSGVPRESQRVSITEPKVAVCRAIDPLRRNGGATFAGKRNPFGIGPVITANTRTVLVDQALAKRMKSRDRI